MQHHSFFIAFTTLLAIINPLEAIPVFLMFSAGKDEKACRDLARRSCIYPPA
jgi:multiple antibiotic resistance protein